MGTPTGVAPSGSSPDVKGRGRGKIFLPFACVALLLATKLTFSVVVVVVAAAAVADEDDGDSFADIRTSISKLPSQTRYQKLLRNFSDFSCQIGTAEAPHFVD